MKKDSLKSTVTPVIALILCSILYALGYFQILFVVPIILLASWIEYGKGIFKSLGFQRNKLKAIDLLVVAPLVSAGMFIFYIFVLVPGVTYFTGQPLDYSVFEPYKGNLPAVIGLFFLIWLSAAFGEEILFRGYLMKQFVKFFGSGRISLVLNILILGVIFGWIHAYQGISGQIVTGVIGALLAIIFHFRKHDLWFNVALHGFFDTIALVFIYRGF